VSASHRILRNVLIPVEDGATLAADLYLPNSGGLAPTLVSFNPYRKDDVAGAFSAPWCERFVQAGYAHLVVDTRGTGGSSGDLNENFDPQEARDGATTVEWVAEQPWSDGAVGVWGMSYGAGMALAVAAQKPPHLRAIATVYGYSDLYLDTAMGTPGCLGRFARENWMLALALAPPGHQDPGGRWRQVWRERLQRLERTGIPAVRWREHADYDGYWAARATDVGSIAVPTFVIGAWRDLFPEAMTRVFEELRVPKRLIMGPWLHVSPDATPVEPIDWLGELVHWWDRWLRERDPRPAPAVTIYVQGTGSWRDETAWPIARTVNRTHYLADGGLDDVPGRSDRDHYDADQRVGVRAGLSDPLGVGTGYPLDQGPDDQASLTYTSDPLAEELEITGSPQAVLFLSLPEGGDCDVVAKLIDVGPNGAAQLITTGWLRAAHRVGADDPKPLDPNVPYELSIRLWATSYAIAPGHRLRLSISCSDFPHIWPSAINPRISLHRGTPTPSRIVLPSVLPDSGGVAPAAVQRPDTAAAESSWDVSGSAKWKIIEDLASQSVSVVLGGHQELRLPDGLSFAVHHAATATVARERPDGARVRAKARIDMSLAGGELVQVRSKSLFHRHRMAYSGDVTIDGVTVFARTWSNP
jgi:putative CocE/NonD family hydrolase